MLLVFHLIDVSSIYRVLFSYILFNLFDTSYYTSLPSHYIYLISFYAFLGSTAPHGL